MPAMRAAVSILWLIFVVALLAGCQGGSCDACKPADDCANFEGTYTSMLQIHHDNCEVLWWSGNVYLGVQSLNRGDDHAIQLDIEMTQGSSVLSMSGMLCKADEDTPEKHDFQALFNEQRENISFIQMLSGYMLRVEGGAHHICSSLTVQIATRDDQGNQEVCNLVGIIRTAYTDPQCCDDYDANKDRC